MLWIQETPAGRVGIVERDAAITHVLFAGDRVPAGEPVMTSCLARRAFEELSLYFQGRLTAFTVPLAPQGSDFEQNVWRALRRIPYGSTASYKEIAEAAGAPKAFRAVGRANNRNPIPIMIPCHRVIGADGALTGYRGGLPLKRCLLDLEAGVDGAWAMATIPIPQCQAV